jgi:hypothetical protein
MRSRARQTSESLIGWWGEIIVLFWLPLRAEGPVLIEFFGFASAIYSRQDIEQRSQKMMAILKAVSEDYGDQ